MGHFMIGMSKPSMARCMRPVKTCKPAGSVCQVYYVPVLRPKGTQSKGLDWAHMKGRRRPS